MEKKTDAAPIENGKSRVEDNQEEIFYDVPDGNFWSTGKEDNNEYDAAVIESSFVVREVTALASVSKHATHYKMNHNQRGIAYIFNHELFDDSRLKPRSDTNEDCKHLKECLADLEFDIQVFQDLKCQDIQSVINDATNLDYTHHDCLLVIVMSYGEKGNIHAKDFSYKPDYLWTSFTADKCPTLAGKPKMFFLQTCEMENTEMIVNLRMSEFDGEIVETYRIPVQADFLIVNSTARGSWFIHSLCQELRERAHENDVMTILTFVSQRVALALQSYAPNSSNIHEEIPCVLSMLTRLIQFKYNE